MSLLRYSTLTRAVIYVFLKFPNFGANVGKITHSTPLIRDFYHNRDYRMSDYI